MAYNLEALESAQEGSIYEDLGRRRSHRVQSTKQRRAAAYASQALSGSRIRIARQVKNEPAFSDELKVWIPFVQTGVAARKSLGNLAMTVFDTAQQPLNASGGYTQGLVEEKLRKDCPELFKTSPRIEVTGTDLFGNMSRPFIGLTLAPGSAQFETQHIRSIVAPELTLGDRHLPDHRLHVSLGQAFTHDHALVIEEALQSVLPQYVQFKAGTVVVEQALTDQAS